MATEWYVQRDDEIQGPYDSPQMKRLAKAGDISPSDRVRQGSDGDWVPAEMIRGLVFKAVGSQATPSNAVPPRRMAEPPPRPSTRVESEPSDSVALESGEVAKTVNTKTQTAIRVLAKLWSSFLLGSIWAFQEINKVAGATWGQAVRLVRWTSASWTLWKAGRHEVDAKIRLGEHLYHVELGDPSIRARLAKLDEKTCDPKSNWFARRQLFRQRKQLVLTLAKEPHEPEKPSTVLEQFEDRVAAAQEEVEQSRQVAEEHRRSLWPDEASEKFRVAVGAGTMFVALVMLLAYAQPVDSQGSLSRNPSGLRDNTTSDITDGANSNASNGHGSLTNDFAKTTSTAYLEYGYNGIPFGVGKDHHAIRDAISGELVGAGEAWPNFVQDDSGYRFLFEDRKLRMIVRDYRADNERYLNELVRRFGSARQEDVFSFSAAEPWSTGTDTWKNAYYFFPKSIVCVHVLSHHRHDNWPGSELVQVLVLDKQWTVDKVNASALAAIHLMNWIGQRIEEGDWQDLRSLPNYPGANRRFYPLGERCQYKLNIPGGISEATVYRIEDAYLVYFEKFDYDESYRGSPWPPPGSVRIEMDFHRCLRERSTILKSRFLGSLMQRVYSRIIADYLPNSTDSVVVRSNRENGSQSVEWVSNAGWKIVVDDRGRASLSLDKVRL